MKQLAMFVVAAVAASASPVTVELTNAGNPIVTVKNLTIGGTSYSNVDIGPYTMLINGINTPALCIDFNDESFLNKSWNANVTPVDATNLNNTYLPSDNIEYKEEAYLYSQIVKPGADRTDIQEAAWEITSYGIADSTYAKDFGIADNSYIDAAVADYSSINLSGYEIISDTNTGKGRNQQFMIDPSPEPASALLLGFGLLAGSGILARTRRRAANAPSAEQK